ncbi:MAG: GDP-mannose 4,6-dehydratase, partial [uncultured Thermomicrobiales bacterium]
AHRADHRHHRPGRQLPGRAPARPRLPRRRRHPAHLDRRRRPDHPPPGADRVGQRRPPGPNVAARHCQSLPTRRGLQPRRPELRPHLLGTTAIDRRDHRPRRQPPPRSRPPCQTGRPLLPGILLRDVRQSPDCAPERSDPVLSALPVRRLKTLRALDYRQLSRKLRSVCRVGYPVQSRVCERDYAFIGAARRLCQRCYPGRVDAAPTKRAQL